MLFHPVLNIPELAAPAPNVILTGRVKHPCGEAHIQHRVHEIAGKATLPLICSGNMFIPFADNGDSCLPYVWVKQLMQTFNIIPSVVARVNTVVKERSPSCHKSP